MRTIVKTFHDIEQIADFLEFIGCVDTTKYIQEVHEKHSCKYENYVILHDQYGLLD